MQGTLVRDVDEDMPNRPHEVRSADGEEDGAHMNRSVVAYNGRDSMVEGAAAAGHVPDREVGAQVAQQVGDAGCPVMAWIVPVVAGVGA